MIPQGPNNDTMDDRNGLNMEQCPAYETTKVTQPPPLPPRTYPPSSL